MRKGMAWLIAFYKKAGVAFMALLALMLVAACGAENGGEEPIDLSDALGGSAILTADDLVRFFDEGRTDTAVLANNIDLEGKMLTLTKARGSLTIEGGGFTLMGSGDCVIRLDDGLKLTLNDLTLIGGSDGIGALGSCTVGGENTLIKGVANAVNCKGFLTVGANSTLTFNAQEGRGVTARGVTLEEKAHLSAEGELGGVVATDSGITLQAGSTLASKTKTNYNALKCAQILILKENAELTVVNEGLYHGAEIDSLKVEGAATINASGGSKGTGLFIYSLDEDIYLLGNCSPEARFENGSGSITFVSDLSAIPTPEP